MIKMTLEIKKISEEGNWKGMMVMWEKRKKQPDEPAELAAAFIAQKIVNDFFIDLSKGDPEAMDFFQKVYDDASSIIKTEGRNLN